jgi:uncharacterized protein (DUF1015 family)
MVMHVGKAAELLKPAESKDRERPEEVQPNEKLSILGYPSTFHETRPMATVRPFTAIRPRRASAADVASRPYDVLNTEEARAETAGNPLCFLHVGKPEIDLPPGTDPYAPAVYAKGSENFQKLLRDGVLVKDASPCFYVYAQTMGAHRQFGIAGCVSVEEYAAGIIRKHELTRPDKEDDRTRHMLAIGAQTGPIFLTYRNVPAIDRLVKDTVVGEAEYDFHSPDKVRHQLWVISDPATVKVLEALFRDVPIIYIADGHHRSASAARAAAELAKTGRGTAEAGFFLAVIFPDNQMQILPYNRLVRDLNGMTPDQLVAKLGKDFDVQKSSGQVTPARKGEFGLYTGGQWYTLVIKGDLRAVPDPVERLDVSVLQSRVFGPLLGIEDQRTSKRIDFVGGIRGTAELQKRVDAGEMAAAFSIFATSIGELLAVADAGRIMPPKSTWFEPKLRDGLLVHSLS